MESLKPIEGSSQIESAAYEDGTLAVKFKSGGVYHYAGVPPDVAESFFASDSKGKYLGANIKGTFDFTKMPQEESDD